MFAEVHSDGGVILLGGSRKVGTRRGRDISKFHCQGM